jgi:3-deoxy-D-manno-octulosonic-acid transferase
LYTLFYHIFLLLFNTSIRLAAWFNPKAAAWVNGRRGLFEQLEKAIDKKDRVIWMHVASLGEFEQGRPLLEKLRTQYPTHRLLLTFFSPSGFEVRKSYSGADWVFYLPMDGPSNAKRFLDITHPELVIFVKYEFWYFYLKKISYRKIPLLLVSAIFHPTMSFFKWYGGISRKMLHRFNHLFVQNEASLRLLQKIGLGAISSIAGDTRFDRVVALASTAKPIASLATFSAGSPILLAGSTWPSDEKIIAEALQHTALSSLKLVVAPHEINKQHIAQLQTLFPDSLLLSSFDENIAAQRRVLILDSIGLLSTAYQHATFAYIGGGFKQAGIHNTLEAAVYGIPLFFGPHYHHFAEAVALVKYGGAFALTDQNEAGTELSHQLNELLLNTPHYQQASEASKNFVRNNQGATAIISKFIQEKLLHG